MKVGDVVKALNGMSIMVTSLFSTVFIKPLSTLARCTGSQL